MAAKKKGLSIEEKRKRLYELISEKKEVFQLKELEKLAPKEKGIVVQSVKEVLQMLVDDGLVDSEKIGTLMCFWAFPSKAVATRKRKINETDKELDVLRTKKSNLETQLRTASKGKDNSAERDSLLKTLSLLETELGELKTELEKYKDFEPDQLEIRRKESQVAKVAANRWTENIFSIKNWCGKKFQIEESVINKQFGIPEDIDYID